MDSQLKERIVGATVLVALGVWLIPWVLDGPEPAPEETAEPDGILLPSADDEVARVRTETVTLTPEPAAAEPERVAVDEGEISLPEPEPLPANPVNETRAPEPAPEVAAPAPEPADPGGWAVQVGAFSQAQNAEQVVSRVSGLGYDAYVSEFQSGGSTLYRVRVGGYATEAQAEAAADSLASHDFRVRVIRPE